MLKNIDLNKGTRFKVVLDEGREFNDFFSSLDEIGKVMVMSYMSALLDKENLKRKEHSNA